ncbi:MAG: hypothetical protein LPK45_09720, partial [Bacteroidota bacterium]|nr:hypothetical protein [Bacteroidota bacterium]MDX5431367.1 hypothetical protein [Bacteroidota bacterium]MDX5470097.1 hypothetical protein [Bacteroidota bacterium]
SQSGFDSSLKLGSNLSAKLFSFDEGKPDMLPKDFDAVRPLTWADRFYFGGSNDLIGLRPYALAQQKMPNPMLQGFHTLYVRSSVRLQAQTRHVIHYESLVLVKSMMTRTLMLPYFGIRTHF